MDQGRDKRGGREGGVPVHAAVDGLAVLVHTHAPLVVPEAAPVVCGGGGGRGQVGSAQVSDRRGGEGGGGAICRGMVDRGEAERCGGVAAAAVACSEEKGASASWQQAQEKVNEETRRCAQWEQTVAFQGKEGARAACQGR